ncbi:response regulator [Costertonia aggregata]|uniref:Response regulator n=1 Tax=Costertonia aggregata TaxID=343403 RepID=A0A7H9ALN0_9FLAO|nr:response regulator [Costertonia aggregata]QLG44274.1 response regulator [Costertonia aggregata]
MSKIDSICIIDDDPIIVFGIKKMLSLVVEYNNLYTYKNGKLAIDGINGLLLNGMDAPDVIFLDINMPIMDGWQFLEEFIALPLTKKVRVNIVTSSIDPVDKERWEFFKSKTRHVVEFNNKPIRKADIKEITKLA